jgi:hypothetical protein
MHHAGNPEREVMDLRTVKRVADLKAQIGPLQRQSAALLNAAVGQAKSAAIADFKNHFTKAGFTVVGESKRYAAAYESMQFFLEIAETAETHGTLSFCEFALIPPASLHEARTTVHMIRKPQSSSGRPVVAEEGSLLRDAERQLADAREALSMAAFEFCFMVVEKENVELPDSEVSNDNRPIFATFADFLVCVYPQ